MEVLCHVGWDSPQWQLVSVPGWPSLACIVPVIVKGWSFLHSHCKRYKSCCKGELGHSPRQLNLFMPGVFFGVVKGEGKEWTLPLQERPLPPSVLTYIQIIVLCCQCGGHCSSLLRWLWVTFEWSELLSLWQITLDFLHPVNELGSLLCPTIHRSFCLPQELLGWSFERDVMVF